MGLLQHPFLITCLFGSFGTSFSNFLNNFVWLRITDEGSVPEIRNWYILLIKSDLKWCIHLGRSLFNILTTWWVSLLVDQWVPESTCSQVLRSTLVDSCILRASKFFVLKLIEIVILWVYYTIPLAYLLILALSGHQFPSFETTLFC